MKKFKKYLEKLQKLDVSDSLINLAETDKIVLLISGSSNYKSAALSQEQQNFLEIFKEYGYEVINSNFPYNQKFEHEEYRDVNIVKASISNIFYYIYTLYSKKFQREIRRHLKFFLNNKRKIIIVSQSSGLNVLKILETDVLQEIRIFALGPVARGNRKTKNMTVVKGTRDFYTRRMDLHKADWFVDCKHFDYLINNEIKENIRGELQKNKD